MQVELDPVTLPGAMASGTVIFSDGEKKGGHLDQMGRIALSGGSTTTNLPRVTPLNLQKDSTLPFAAKAFSFFRSLI